MPSKYGIAECDICRDAVPVHLILQLPSVNFPSKSSVGRVCLCKRHVQQFISGLSLDDGYTVDTLTSYFFNDSDVREDVFGSQDNYTAFVYLWFQTVNRLQHFQDTIESAIDLKDWLTALKISCTYNWEEMKYYEIGDMSQNPSSGRILTLGQVDSYADFLYRFISATPDFEWKFLGQDCKVYISVLNTCIKIPTLGRRQKIYDRYYVVVSTNPNLCDDARVRLGILENFTNLDYVPIVEKFEIPYNDLNISTLTKSLALLQEKNMTVFEDGGITPLTIFITQWWSHIGLRYWSDDDRIFDYVI